jgi:hypothetical protein
MDKKQGVSNGVTLSLLKENSEESNSTYTLKNPEIFTLVNSFANLKGIKKINKFASLSTHECVHLMHENDVKDIMQVVPGMSDRKFKIILKGGTEHFLKPSLKNRLFI